MANIHLHENKHTKPSLKDPNGKMRKRLLKNLEEVFCKYIRKRDRYSCVITGETRNTGVARFFRGSEAVLYDELNTHNLSLRLISAHHNKNPLVYTRYMYKTHASPLLVRLEEVCEKDRELSIQEIIDLTNMYAKKTIDLGEVKRWGK